MVAIPIRQTVDSCVTRSESETITLGTEFAKRLRAGSVVALFGELGTGKTRFIKGTCRGLGVNEHVASPTFTIVNQYDGAHGLKIFHFDFYRLRFPAMELREIGFAEYIDSADGISLIEWADRVQDFLPANRFDVHLSLGDNETTRRITITEVVGVAA
jgi:tRNA threonylcarbamoyladenosine biosynthesis protein TsaE